MKRKNKNKIKKRKFSALLIFLSVILEFAGACIICASLVLYGPFANTRKMFVGAVEGTFSHKWIANLFYSDAQIKAILGTKAQTTLATQNLGKVNVGNADNSDIKVEKVEAPNGRYKGYMLIVSDARRVHVGVTSKIGKVGESTSNIARDHDAIAAINGGGFNGATNWTGTGNYPDDFVFADGKFWENENISDSKAKRNVIGFDSGGHLIVGTYTVNQLKSMNVTDAVTMDGSAYRPIVLNGKGQYDGDEGMGMNPRTAIGQKNDGTVLMLVLDGRQGLMAGATPQDVQQIMLQFGAYNAGWCDGGSSTTMYYNGNVINNPCNPLGERTVATAFYVAK